MPPSNTKTLLGYSTELQKEPIFFPKLQIEFADFPYWPYYDVAIEYYSCAPVADIGTDRYEDNAAHTEAHTTNGPLAFQGT